MTDTRKSASGFTLVELGVVLVIVGVLIGGVLKGRELLDNARVNALVMQLKTYEVAVQSFQKMYGALPGDFRDASTRLNNCNANPCNNGDGDGVIGVNQPNAAQKFAAGAENRYFWTQMARAGILNTAVDAGYTATPNRWGTDFPVIPGGMGGITVNYDNVTAAVNTPYPALSGHDFRVQSTFDDSATFAIAASTVAKVDRKIDDGFPLTGRVLGIGGSNCNAGGNIYPEGTGQLCNLWMTGGF